LPSPIRGINNQGEAPCVAGQEGSFHQLHNTG
jgi:hypothetical protein